MEQRIRLYLGSFGPDGPHSFPIYLNRRRQAMMVIMSELYAAEPGWLEKSDRGNHFNNWLQTEEGKSFAQEIVTVPGSKYTLRHIAMPLIAAVALLTRGLRPSIIRNDGLRQLQSVLKKRVLSVGIMGLLQSGVFRVCDDDCTLMKLLGEFSKKNNNNNNNLPSNFIFIVSFLFFHSFGPDPSAHAAFLCRPALEKSNPMALYRCIQPAATQPADEMMTDDSSSSSSSSSASSQLSSGASLAVAPPPSQSASASSSRPRASSVEKYFFRDVGQVTCLRPDADIRCCRHSALIELHVDQRAWAANDQLLARLSLATMPEAQFAMMFGADVVPAPIIPAGTGSESASAASASSSSEMDVCSAQSTVSAVQQPPTRATEFIPQLQPVTHQQTQVAMIEDAPIATLDNVVSALMISTKLTAATASGSDAVVGIGPSISILETLGIDKSASADIPGQLKIIYRRESTRSYTDAELQQLRANGQSISHLPRALSLKAFAHLARSHAHRINPILSRRTLTQMMEVRASLS